MAEALGAASSILALVIFAYDASKSLYEAIDSFKSQRKAIVDVQADLTALITCLNTTRGQAQDQHERLEPLREPLGCCASICQEMHEMLATCTKHAKPGQDSIRVWLKMQFHDKSFGELKQRLDSYKSTLMIAFDTIHIHDQVHTQDSLQHLKNSIAGTKEDLEDQLDLLRQTVADADTSMRAVLQADQTRLQKSLDTLAQAEQTANAFQIKVVITNNRASQDTRTLFGTDTTNPHFNLHIADNEVGSGSIMGAGVHTPETLQALLRSSNRGDIALTMRSLQSHSGGVSTDNLQRISHDLTGRDDQEPSAMLLESSSPSSRTHLDLPTDSAAGHLTNA